MTNNRSVSFRAAINFSLRNSPLRKPRGQAIIEGAVALCLIAMMLVAAVAMLFFVGNTLYTKVRLSFVATQAAQCALGKISFCGRLKSTYGKTNLQAQVQHQLEPVLATMNLEKAKIKIEATPAANPEYVKATVELNDIPVLTGGRLPASINIVETATLALADAAPEVVSCLTFENTNTGSKCIYFPSYYYGGINTHTNAGPTSGTFYVNQEIMSNTYEIPRGFQSAGLPIAPSHP